MNAELTTETDLIDGFAARCRQLLAEAIGDGAEGEELRESVVVGVETLLTCHFCGEPGLPPCCEDDDSADPASRSGETP